MNVEWVEGAALRIAYNDDMAVGGNSLLMGLTTATVLLQRRASYLPVLPEPELVHKTVVVDRAAVIITGKRARLYRPEIRFFEIQNRRAHERFVVEMNSANERFVLLFHPEEYELDHVQISEGPFLSMARLTVTFLVRNDPITYVGFWRFEADSPKYGRMLSLAMEDEVDDRTRATEFLMKTYPSLDKPTVVTVLPNPPILQARLFEIMSYPRYPTYFRRQWW